VLNKCWQFIATALILLAVMITVARYMMPGINNYRESIEQYITDKSGIAISIGHIEGSWDSLGAFITISDIRFGTKSDTVTENNTSIGAVKIGVATFPSLFYRTLITDFLTIENLSLKIRQKQSSEFFLPDIVKQSSGSSESTPILASTIQDWLQNQAKIILHKTHLDISLHNGHQYPVNLDQITFQKGKNIYQLTGMSKLPGDNQIDITLEVNGFLTDPSTVGQLYIDTHQINMQELPANALLEEAEIKSGTLDLKIWADWNNKQFESALISLDIDDFQMSLMNEPQTNLNKVKSFLVWHRQANGWIFDSQKTEIISDDRNWPDPSLQIEMFKKDSQKQYSISASRLDVGIWADLILANPNLDTQIKKQLLAMNINGLIDDSRIYASFEDQTMTKFRANARFSELGWQPWKKIPGITNLAGQFEIHQDKGLVILDSRNSKLNYPNLFRWPFDIESINSRFSWNISEQVLALNLYNLTTDITEAELQADGNFNIMLDSGLVDLNLYAELNRANIAKTKYFLPTGIMTNKLVNYLDSSIKSGTLDSAQIAIRGPAKQFPYPTNPEGVFSINAQISKTRYNFTEGWPEIDNISADLWFVENSMDIKITSGKSVNQNISSATIGIEDFKAKPAILLVQSTSSGSVEHGINYLNQSPLHHSIGKIFETIPAKGPFTLNLDLTIPLDEEPVIRVDGKVHLTGNSLVVQPVDMNIENIKGDLIITNSVLSADNLTAEFMGGKSNLTLQQSSDENKISTTTILTEGNITADGIRTVFPDWLPVKIIGQTNYRSQLLLPEVVTKNDIKMDLTVESELQGISSQFPPPFNKSAEEKEVFLLKYQILNNNQQLLGTSISKIADLKLHFSDQSATTGRIVFGGEKAAVSGKEGIELTGQFEHFALAPWLDLLSEETATKEKLLSDDYSHLYINNLVINKLNYFFMEFDQVTAAAIVKDHSFNFTLLGDDISGLIKIPDANQELPIDINLTKLRIKDQFPTVTENKTNEETRKSFANPLPPLDIHCQQCIYNDKEIGNTIINIRPLENGNSFDLKMEGEDILDLNIQGEWLADTELQVVTNLSGKMTTNKLGNLLTLFNRKTGIHDTDFETNGDLSWQGDPLQFNYQTLNGKLAIKGGKGNQEDVSDSGARLFSLLSIGSLARKLTLDFSDLFGKGFFYTGMNGSFIVNNGVFTTTDFKIDGTSADVEIVGRSDFPNNQIQNCILVTPDLSASLPVLAGWAIEPVTGLLVYLMSKIFQPVLKVVTSIQYKIEGSFDSPEITEIGKSEGVVKVDNSEHIGGRTSIITEDTDQQKFNCDDIFNK